MKNLRILKGSSLDGKCRLVIATGEGYTTRTETFEGREHLVVPVVALVEGVVHAMNAQTPEFVPAEEFSRAPSGWNGRPIFEGHPMENGHPVSGNSPSLLATKKIGIVFNSTAEDDRLKMEAWIDVEVCAERAPKLLERLRATEPVEISVGTFVETDDSSGMFGGKRYKGAWRDLTPDHLALLPEGDVGACSRDAGCGVRAAKEQDSTMYEEFKTLRNIPQADRDKMDDKDFAGPSRSFPIAEPDDVAAAANSLGRAKGDRAAIKRKIVDIAYRKGTDYVSQLPDDWKRKGDQKNMLARMLSSVTGLFRASQDADEMGSNDLKCRLSDAIQEIEPGLAWVDDYFPVTDPAHVVYTITVPTGIVYGVDPYTYPGYDYIQYERAFTLGDTGTIALQAARVPVRSVSRWEPVEGAQPESDSAITTLAQRAEQNTESGAPRAASTETPTSQGTHNMDKSGLIKALDGAKDLTVCQIQALADVLSGKAKAVEVTAAGATATETPAAVTPAVPAVPAVVAPVAPAVAEAPKEVTLADLMAKATPDQRAAFEGITRVAAETKASTIKSLKATGRCTYTDEQLGAMDQGSLDSLTALAGVPKTASVDYSGRGEARAASQTNEVPAPPDMASAIRAARGQK